jgi:hypothetical protein
MASLATLFLSFKRYLWCSNRLVDEQSSTPDPKKYRPKHLIPLEDESNQQGPKKIVIGHNIAYDRARTREQYSLDNVRE